MATPPELYLSLLSGNGDLSHISTESRHNDLGSRISNHPSAADPNRIMDLLDALAAICVHRAKGETFFVSLAMDSDSTTLYISSNHTVPATVTNYLFRIRDQLKNLRDALEFPSITNSNEILPKPNLTLQRTKLELGLQEIIYEHTYLKLRQRFFKRAPAILKEYPAIEKTLTREGITTEEAALLQDVQQILQFMKDELQSEKLPTGEKLHFLITGIAAIAADKRLKGAEIVTRWDNLIRTSTLPFRICFHSSSLTLRYRVQSCPDQDIISGTVARETIYPSPPYLDHHTCRMVSPTLAVPHGKFPRRCCTSRSP